MTLLATIFKYTGWLPFTVAAVFAGLSFQQKFNSDPLQALATSLMVLVGFVAMIMVAGACFYQVKNGYFSFREVATLAFIAATAIISTFCAWVVVSERFDVDAVLGSAAFFFLFVPLFWLGFVFAFYAMPRVIGLNPLFR